ncbi:MAG: 50S ribosomal protein L23 [Candidatus Pacebacteria bacterium]|nr:50S ribosomal protein L23 [Candidatus Paceibacterota bacterium]MCF7857428.1 50S ribosomal protein L23 [Candidatus Paceibacterota bacterium]
MGIFGKKDEPETKTAEVAVVKEAKPGRINTKSVTSAIVKPRITEKAALLSDNNVYTFEIQKGASKFDVRDAIKALYNVTPTKVHIVNKQPRHSMSRSRGRDMMEHGLRKAYVYLKKGDRIELV